MTAPKNSGDGWIVPEFELSETQRTKLLEDLDNNRKAVHAVERAVARYLAIQQCINADPGPAEDKGHLVEISKCAHSLSRLLERLPLSANEGLEQGFLATTGEVVDPANVQESIDGLALAAKWYCDVTGQRSGGRPKEWERLYLIRSLRDIYFEVFKKEPAHRTRTGPFIRIVVTALDADIGPTPKADRVRELIKEALETPTD